MPVNISALLDEQQEIQNDECECYKRYIVVKIKKQGSHLQFNTKSVL